MVTCSQTVIYTMLDASVIPLVCGQCLLTAVDLVKCYSLALFIGS